VAALYDPDQGEGAFVFMISQPPHPGLLSLKGRKNLEAISLQNHCMKKTGKAIILLLDYHPAVSPGAHRWPS
jgi:hypothetical protein